MEQQMTQFRDRVNEVRRQERARTWAAKGAYIYAHDGVTEIHYNSGRVTHFLGVKTNIFGQTKSIEEEVHPADDWELIMMRFGKDEADRRNGAWVEEW